jgi:hypothetical protein
VSTAPALTHLTVAADPAAWEGAGFSVEDGQTTVGQVEIRFTPEGHRITGWSLHGLDSVNDLDGLPTTLSDAPPRPAAEPHPNHVTGVDHVVAFSPDLNRTVAALDAAGLDLRRIREEPTPAGAPRQAFFRVGEPILEVIQAPEGSPAMENPAGPAGFWGLAFVVDDIDAAVASLGDGRVNEPRPAVQEGRRIATLRRDAGLGLPVALMTPRA